MVAFLAELNDLDLYATDIGNAYLEAITTERVYIVAGPEFGELEGHMLVIYKALYGLRSSGIRWHSGFLPVSEIWVSFRARRNRIFGCDLWTTITSTSRPMWMILQLAPRTPMLSSDSLKGKYKFKLKGTGEIYYHLGMTFHRNDRNDPNGTLRRW